MGLHHSWNVLGEGGRGGKEAPLASQSSLSTHRSRPRREGSGTPTGLNLPLLLGSESIPMERMLAWEEGSRLSNRILPLVSPGVPSRASPEAEPGSRGVRGASQPAVAQPHRSLEPNGGGEGGPRGAKVDRPVLCVATEAFLPGPAWVHSVCCSAWSCGGSRDWRGDWGEGGGVWGGEGWAMTGVEERKGVLTGRAEGELGVAPGGSTMGRL